MAIESGVPRVVGAQLAHAEQLLARTGSSVAQREACELLSSVLGLPASVMLARSDSAMSEGDVETYARWVARRAAGEAIAHITGHLAFMGLDLTVRPDTPLVRAGTERVVEAALERARQHASGELAAAEIGTGCGAIALALAAFEPRFTRLYAVDGSASVLEVAAANGARYLLNLVINWVEGNGLDTVPEPVDLIVYGQQQNDASSQIARLLEEAPTKLRPGGALICRLDHGQEPVAVVALGRALPAAHVWVNPPADGMVIAVAQLPRSARDDATVDTRR